VSMKSRKLSTRAIAASEAKRDIAAEVLRSVKDIKAGKGKVALSPAVEARAVKGLSQSSSLPEYIALAEYPQLRRLAWSARGLDSLTPAEALGLYQRNCRHVDVQALEAHEQRLLDSVRSLSAQDAKADD
jgi:hypothetical protein